MSQSFFQIYAHIIFSTKNRERWLNDAIRNRVHAYLATIAHDHGCSYVRVGGAEDHVHMLLSLDKKTLLVDLIGKVKKESSKFVKTLGISYERCYWQNGYGAFSVGFRQRDFVADYINGQIEHHRKQTFEDELRSFLERYELEYDERYLWD